GLYRRNRLRQLQGCAKNDHHAGRRFRRRGGFRCIHQGNRIIMATDKILTVDAEPYPFEYSPATCALLIIDMQRDFLEPGGFGEMLGNDVSQLRRTIEPNQKLLAVWRAKGWQVMHTREGHRPDLGCLPPAKKVRGRSPTTI